MQTKSDSVLRQHINYFSNTFPTADLDEGNVVARLRERGITTVEQLVSHTLSNLREGQPRPAQLIGVEKRDSEEPITHTPPQIPVTIDGIEHDPRDISRFDGTPLHFIFSRLPDGQPSLQATSDGGQLQVARLIWRALNPLDWQPPGPTPPVSPPGQPPPQPPGPGSYVWPPGGGTSGQPVSPPPPQQPPGDWGSVQMFSDVNYQGDWFWLNKGYEWARLSKVSRGTVLFFSGDWNDQISSIGWTGGPVTYYEHANFQGSSMTIPPKQPTPELVTLGWNDRISSVRYS